jgi:hypothetical protein
MEDLRNIMRLIDANSNTLPEGDYLAICNSLRNVFKDRTKQEMTNLFDYENFTIFLPDTTDDVLDYFYDHYYNASLEYDREFLGAQRVYLENELNVNRPIKRVTKYVKEMAIKHYCALHNILLDTYDTENLRKYHDDNNYDLGGTGTKFDIGLKKLFRSYIDVENHYRSIYCSTLYERINKIDDWMDDLDGM